ncbi:MAG: B12-binding domain-containing radical SAM protein [Chloroflexota bacterium]
MPGNDKVDALFVGYENQENLGLRYIISYLEAHGHRCDLIPYSPGDPTAVAHAIARGEPDLVGFSIIFQYSLHEFGLLMEQLRGLGINAHFTAGGHYPSLCPEKTMAELPALDSLVRFEGELTTLDLLRTVKYPDHWLSIPGLVFRRHGGVVLNPPRPLVDNLDILPWPKRSDVMQTCRGIPTAPILASRGCLFNCSFCSIRQFYGSAPGALRRSRSARDVVAEMKDLYERRNVRLFLFQDDDFAAKSTAQRAWVQQFLDALRASGLSSVIRWKISCRVDDVEAEIMAQCRDHGLMAVYLGVESGNSRGLQTLNKHVTVEQNIAAMRILKDLDLTFDIGFMLFDPDSTIDSVRENIRFLREVARMGGPPLSFVKMLPLAGTAVQARLAAEGRLTGDAVRPDYDLLDPRLDYYCLFVTLNFSHRNSDPQGLVERLRLSYFDCLVAKLFRPTPDIENYETSLRALIDRTNDSALETLDKALTLVETCPDSRSVALRWPRLNAIAMEERRCVAEIASDLDQVLEAHSPALCQTFREQDLRREVAHVE